MAIQILRQIEFSWPVFAGPFGCHGNPPFDEDELVVAHPLLRHLGSLPQVAWLETLLALHVAKGGEQRGARRLGNPLKQQKVKTEQ